MITQQARSDVYVNGQQAGQELDSLAKKAAKLKQELVEMRKANDKAGFDKKQKELKSVNTEMKNLQKQAFDVNKVLKNMKSASLNDLYKAQRKLNSEMKKLPPNSKEFKQMSTDAKALASHINRVKNNIKGQNTAISSSGKLWSNMKGLLPVVGLTTIVTLLGKAGRGLIDLRREMDGDSKRSAIVFGDQLGYVAEQADYLAKKMGLTRQQFIANAASTADLLIPLNFTRIEAAKMSVELQSLTGAMDEWTGGKVGAKEVSNILTKAMLGENEQLKQLGIAIKMDSEEYRSLVKIKMETENVTKAQAQAMTTLELIQRKSVDAQRAYNTEGNKLLRFQKELALQLRTVKESIVARFEVPAAQLLQEEADKANLLVAQLMNVNLEEKMRSKLFIEIGKLYPDILKGISQESIDTKKLAENLAAYNKEMAAKIALSSLEEDQEKIFSEQAQLKLKLSKLQTAAILKLNSSSEYLVNKGVTKEIINDFEELRKLVLGSDVQGIDSGRFKTILDVIFEKSSKAGSAAGVTSDILRTQFLAMIPAIDQAGNSLRKYIDNNADSLLLLSETRNLIMSSLGEETNLENDDDDDAVDKAAYQAYLFREKIKSEILKRNQPGDNPINWIFDEEEMMVDDTPWLSEWTDKFWGEFEDSYVGQKEKLQAMLDHNLITVQEYNNKVSEIEENQRIESDRISRQKLEDQFSAYTQMAADITNAMIDTWADRKQSELNYNVAVAELNDDLQRSRLTQEEFNVQMANLNADRKKEEIALEKARGKETLKVMLEYLRKYAHAKIAEITVGSLASAESIATFGIAGLAKAAILTGLVEGAIGLAQAKLSQNYDGRYPVVGASDNRTYNATLSGPATTGIYSTPSLVGEKGTEMIVDYPTYQQISINRPDIIRDIMSMRVPQFASGSYPVSKKDVSTKPNSKPSEEAILLNKLLVLLASGNVKAVIDDYEVRKLRDRTNFINDIEAEGSK